MWFRRTISRLPSLALVRCPPLLDVAQSFSSPPWLAVLALRGRQLVAQPLQDDANNVLLWNGEVFGGIKVTPCITQARWVTQSSDLTLSWVVLCPGERGAERHRGVAGTPFWVQHHDRDRRAPRDCRGTLRLCLLASTSLSRNVDRRDGMPSKAYPTVKASNKRLFFGKDKLGRRSLLLHRPSSSSEPLLLSSVAALPQEIYESTTPAKPDKEKRCTPYMAAPGNWD